VEKVYRTAIILKVKAQYSKFSHKKKYCGIKDKSKKTNPN